jgi:hypothetical protein
MDRKGSLVSIGNTLPLQSKDEAKVIFEVAAPRLAHRLMQLAEQRLMAEPIIQEDMSPEQELDARKYAREEQDSGIEILSTFKKQLFTEKPTVSMNIHAKTGFISEDAKTALDHKLGRSREVVAQATVVSEGDR